MSNLKNTLGGRHKDPVWACFESCSVNNVNKQKCIACGTLVSAKAPRLKQHLQKCSKIKRDDDNNQINEDKLDGDLEESSKRKRIDIESPSCSYILKQPSMSNYIIKTTTAHKEELDKAMAKFFYACNIPFRVCENKHFKDFIQVLRPGYEPPNRKQLSGDLLNKIHDEIMNEAQTELKGKTVTLMQDGWSDVHNTPIIANILSTGESSYFLSAIDSGSNVKSADYCLDVAKAAIEEAAIKFNCKVQSFVSDNEKKMVLMRKKLTELYNDEKFISYGCASHYLNLVGEEIFKMKNIRDFIANILEVQKYFRNHHRAGAWLKNCEGSCKPQLPGETRWNSQLKCLETYIRNRPFYLQIVDEHENDIDDKISSIINNVMIHKEAKSLYSQLIHIANALDKCQAEECSIADSTKLWITLINNEELKPYKNILEKRFSEAVTPAHMLAYLLHPQYNSIKLSEKQEETARNYAAELSPDFLPLIIAFQAEAKPFPKSFFFEKAKNMNVRTWWKALRKNDDLPTDFIDFVIHLHNCPASSASIERVFSNLSFIQNKIRNRLGTEVASKLVFCYKMLNGKRDPDLCW